MHKMARARIHAAVAERRHDENRAEERFDKSEFPKSTSQSSSFGSPADFSELVCYHVCSLFGTSSE